jgi:ribonuclease R
MGITTESLESRFEIQRVLAEMAGRSEEYAVNYAVLRSLPKATYGPQPEGHFALASGCYCHFTSPIRRYPDLTVHRVLDALLRGKRPDSDFDRLLELGEHCSQREQRAEQAERELTKLKLLNYLSRRIGQTMEVVVTGVEDFGLFAQGIELPAEGLIHVSSLRDDHYHYDAVSHTLTGHRAGNAFRLGDRLRVEVARVDLDARQLDYRLIGRGTEDRPPPANRRSKKGVKRSTGGRGPRAPVARDKRSKPQKSKRRG